MYFGYLKEISISTILPASELKCLDRDKHIIKSKFTSESRIHNMLPQPMYRVAIMLGGDVK